MVRRLKGEQDEEEESETEEEEEEEEAKGSVTGKMKGRSRF